MDSVNEPDRRLPSLKARKVKLKKREIALAYLVGALVTFAAVGIFTDGFGGPGSYFSDDPATEIASER